MLKYLNRNIKQKKQRYTDVSCLYFVVAYTNAHNAQTAYIIAVASTSDLYYEITKSLT